MFILFRGCGGNSVPADSTGVNNSEVSSAQNEGNEAVSAQDESSGVSSAQNESSESSPVQNEIEQIIGSRGTKLSVSANGEFSIIRITDSIEPIEMPHDGMWTVFVYMCGSNLESQGGCATNDLLEMLAATTDNPNLRFVIEAGGSNSWRNEVCDDGKNTKLVISEGNIQKLEGEAANMGDANTLVAFLDWGLANYSSQYMVLDFWDHGGASIAGVCMDERFEDDGLTLMEIDGALAALYSKYAFKYEMIGCDACLMSTIETANILVPYANYMIASEETEPGTGWDYTGFGNAVRVDVGNGAELGRYMCDAYIASSNDKALTLSVIDLAKLDQFLQKFNAYCTEIYDYVCNQNGIDNIMLCARNLPSFGGGEFNSTDLGLFLKYTSAYSNKAESALQCMNECVVYMRNSDAYKDVSGIAVYFPIDYSVGSKHFDILRNICVTPFYIGIVDVCAYGKANAGDISAYDDSQWGNENSEYWTDNDADNNEYDNSADNSPDTSEIHTTQSGISFSVEPHCEKGNFDAFSASIDMLISLMQDEDLVMDHMDDLDKYTFTFSDEGIKNVDTIYTRLLQESATTDGRAILVDLGYEFVGEGEFYRQNNQKTIEQVFLGMSAGLDNGEILARYPLTRRYVDGYGYVNFYYTPVQHNNIVKYLIFYEYFIEQDPSTWVPTARTEYIAVGTVDIGGGDYASRVEPLNKDDILVALYPAYDRETGEFVNYVNHSNDSPYICQEDGDLRLRTNLEYADGTYKWIYRIDDIYGNSLETQSVTCTIDHNEIWPYSIDD